MQGPEYWHCSPHSPGNDNLGIEKLQRIRWRRRCLGRNRIFDDEEPEKVWNDGRHVNSKKAFMMVWIISPQAFTGYKNLLQSFYFSTGPVQARLDIVLINLSPADWRSAGE